MNKVIVARAVNVGMVVVLLALAACAPAAEPTRDPSAPLAASAAATVLPAAPLAISATPTVLSTAPPAASATPTASPTALAPATPTATPDWSRLIGDDLALRGPDAANQALPEFTAWAREVSGLRDQLGAEADEIFRLVEEAQATMAQELIRQLEAGGKTQGLAALFPPRSRHPSEMGQTLALGGVLDVFLSLISRVEGNSSSVAQPSVTEKDVDKELAEGIKGHVEMKTTLMGSQLEADVKITVVIEKDGKSYEEKASGKLSGNICPDEQGRVPLNLSMEISGNVSGGGGFTMTFTVQAGGQVDDEANLATVEEEIQVEMSVRQVNTWPFGGERIERSQLSFRNVTTGLLGDKGATCKATGVNPGNDFEAMTANFVGALAIVTMNGAYDMARLRWQSGCCVEIVVPETRLIVGAGAEISFTANVHHRFENTDLKAPVVATLLSGAGSVTPANTKVPAPATFVYTAPDETGDAQVELVSRSRRGIGELKARFEIQANYYRVDSFIGLYSQVPLAGAICDLELPFILWVEGQNPSGGKYEGDIRFTPVDANGGTWVHIATSEVRGLTGTVSGSGTYRVEGVAEGKPILKMPATTAKSEVKGYVAEYDWPAWEIVLIPEVGTCLQE